MDTMREIMRSQGLLRLSSSKPSRRTGTPPWDGSPRKKPFMRRPWSEPPEVTAVQPQSAVATGAVATTTEGAALAAAMREPTNWRNVWAARRRTAPACVQGIADHAGQSSSHPSAHGPPAS